MKKLYRKGQVHPSPSPSSPSSTSSSPNSDQFSLNYLPAAILTLAASLSSEDKQVLAYLLSCSSNTPFDFDPSKSSSSSSKKHPQIFINNSNNSNQQHPPSFSCYCFTCYTSYWARWDSSPNRQLIHEIIDAFEDNLLSQRKKKKQGLSRKEKRKNNNIIKGISLDANDVINGNDNTNHQNDEVNGLGRVIPDLGRVDSVEEGDDDDDKLCDETGEKQGSVRKIVSFIGERIWGSVWG